MRFVGGILPDVSPLTPQTLLSQARSRPNPTSSDLITLIVAKKQGLNPVSDHGQISVLG